MRYCVGLTAQKHPVRFDLSDPSLLFFRSCFVMVFVSISTTVDYRKVRYLMRVSAVARSVAAMMLSECYRVLRKGGYMFIITYGMPNSRLNYLQGNKLKWKVTHEIIGT